MINYYLPRTEEGKRWRVMAYWFATGIVRVNGGTDHAEEFGQFVASHVDAYAEENATHHGSIYSEWDDFLAIKAAAAWQLALTVDRREVKINA